MIPSILCAEQALVRWTRSAFVVHTSSVGRHRLCAVQHSRLALTFSLLCRITWHSFMTQTHQTHVTFLHNIRKYNYAIQMTSFECNEVQ